MDLIVRKCLRAFSTDLSLFGGNRVVHDLSGRESNRWPMSGTDLWLLAPVMLTVGTQIQAVF